MYYKISYKISRKCLSTYKILQRFRAHFVTNFRRSNMVANYYTLNFEKVKKKPFLFRVSCQDKAAVSCLFS